MQGLNKEMRVGHAYVYGERAGVLRPVGSAKSSNSEFFRNLVQDNRKRRMQESTALFSVLQKKHAKKRKTDSRRHKVGEDVQLVKGLKFADGVEHLSEQGQVQGEAQALSRIHV